jgi:hypothetical protein
MINTNKTTTFTGRQLLRNFFTERNYAAVDRKRHVNEYLLWLMRRSYERMHRRERNLVAIYTITTNASQLRVVTPQFSTTRNYVKILKKGATWD